MRRPACVVSLAARSRSLGSRFCWCGCRETRPSSSRDESIFVNETAEFVAPSQLDWIRMADAQRLLLCCERGLLSKGAVKDDVRCSDQRTR